MLNFFFLCFSFLTITFNWENTYIEIPVGDDLIPYLSMPSATYSGEAQGEARVFYGYDGTSASTINTSVIGKYLLVYRARAGNFNIYEKKTVVFEVYDSTPPIFTYIPSFELEYGDIPPDFVRELKYTDNYQSAEELRLNLDTSKVDYNRTGIYPVIYTIFDSSNNKNIATTTIRIVDTKPPDLIPFIHTITIGEEIDFSRGVIAIDNCDEDVIYNLSYTTDVNVHQVGEYKIRFSVHDQSNNHISKEVPVYVVDDIPPKIVVKNISIYEGEKINYWEHVEIIDHSDIVKKEISNPADANIAGKYNVTFLIEDEFGNIAKSQILVDVKKNNSDLVFSIEETNLKVNEEFNPFDYVILSDNELLSMVNIVYNDVNVELPGEYLVVYELDIEGGPIYKEAVFRIEGEEIKTPVFPEIEKSVPETETIVQDTETIENDENHMAWLMVSVAVAFVLIWKIVKIISLKKSKISLE